MNGILSQTVASNRPRFWARQFAPDATPSQETFDVIFAIFLPVLVLVVDFGVFKGVFGFALLEDYQLVTYVLAAIAMGVFLTWRTFRTRLTGFEGGFASVFFLSAIYSAGIGFALLPYSVIGLTLLLGILGFMPFFTAFVFLRSGIRAVQHAHPKSVLPFLAAMVGGVLLLILPVLATVRVENSMANSVNTMLSGNAVEARAAADSLKRFPFVPDKFRNRIAEAYWRENDPFKRAVLKEVYEDVFRRDLRDSFQMID